MEDAEFEAILTSDLRDHFAGLAMAAIIAKSPFLPDPPETAIGAYDYADAMLAAREASRHG